jgi:hypothetical protein
MGSHSLDSFQRVKGLAHFMRARKFKVDWPYIDACKGESKAEDKIRHCDPLLCVAFTKFIFKPSAAY